MIPKFRAWDKVEKVMHYNVQDVYDGMCSTVQASSFGQILEEPMQDEDLNDIPGTLRYEVMQFTGLLDKNKSELYDKDIVNVWDKGFRIYIRPAVLTWDKTGRWMFDFGYKEPYFAHELFRDLSGAGIDDVFSDMVEKIGNIFKNPDLLTDELRKKYIMAE